MNRNTKDIRLQTKRLRNANECFTYISDNIVPFYTIYTDSWWVYRGLESLVIDYHTLNHSIEFISAGDSKIHT